MKRMCVAVLGSTGSIGVQALDVIARHSDRFEVVALAAGGNAELLKRQAEAFRPKVLHLRDASARFDYDAQWSFGDAELKKLCALPETDAVLVSVVGVMGFPLVMESLRRGKRTLIANKEPLVAAGALVMAEAARTGAALLPVDSEHSAIFQCLEGANKPAKLWLTASGGPFRGMTGEQTYHKTPADALRHPNWSMGAKITVDSASMMNKGLEVIEASHLFGVAADNINVVIHPQSIIHSMVEFTDGAFLAQMGAPDMRLPILYAFSYPERLPMVGVAWSPHLSGNLTFEEPDMEAFPCLKLAYNALRAGGYAPCVLNGANEAAVELFLSGRIPFGAIPELVEAALCNAVVPDSFNEEGVLECDRAARASAMAEAARRGFAAV